jgi:aryl-alcohol dehydrogenase-like predicted oxidoreductase
MEYRYLGSSGLKVSEVCFGVMTFNGGKKSEIGSIEQPLANELTGFALDHGINFFDTADVYSIGVSEMMLGKALGSRRKEAVIATKVRFPMSNHPNDTGLSRHHIIESCNASLKRLNTDFIDLYQIHSYDPGTPLDETLRAMDDLVRSGKVRYIGCSNLTAWQTMKSLAISEKMNLEKFITTQLYYSIGARDIEHELLPLCQDQCMGILCWSPLSGGFFTGKYTRTNRLPENSRRSHREASTMKYWATDEEKGFDLLDIMATLTSKYQKTVAQIALRWVLQRPSVSSVIIGASNLSQLMENAGCSDWQLDKEDMDLLTESGAMPVPYPQSHQLSSDVR